MVQVVLVDQVVMGVRQAVVAILVPMDVRTTFHLVTQANISSTVAGIVDLLVQGVQVLAHNSLAWAWVHLVLRALLVRGPPAIILRGRHILQCLCPANKWAEEDIQVLIAIMARQTTMDPRVDLPDKGHRACNLRQIQAILLVLIRILHSRHHMDIHQILQ